MNTTNTKQVLHSETPFTLVILHAGAVKEVRHLAHIAAGVGSNWYIYNDARRALANLVAHADMRPRMSDSNLQALFNHLLQQVGGTVQCAVYRSKVTGNQHVEFTPV